ncbi:MAG: FkbM family methyltransferase [Chloroflexi bacterium]|nr:FkbM family methyltransferase [Chloroflexota bacterium]
MLTRLRHFIGTTLRNWLQPGHFYRIPFGPARGQFVEFHPEDNLDILFGFHEPNTFEVFRQLVKPGMVVADIGANHGYFSVFLNKMVGPNGLVYAFEPVPKTFAVLQRALAQNGASVVKPVCAAVSNKNKPVSFYLSHSHYMASLDAKWAKTLMKRLKCGGEAGYLFPGGREATGFY